jgi:hypothetical protein
MAGGDIDPDIAGAGERRGAGHNIIISPFSTQTALTALRTHLDFVSGPMEQRGAIGVAGWPGTLPGPRWLHDSTAVVSRWAGITVRLCCRQNCGGLWRTYCQ